MPARRWDATQPSHGQETQQAPGGWPGARTEAVCVGEGGKGEPAHADLSIVSLILPSQAPTYSGSVPLCANIVPFAARTATGPG